MLVNLLSISFLMCLFLIVEGFKKRGGVDEATSTSKCPPLFRDLFPTAFRKYLACHGVSLVVCLFLSFFLPFFFGLLAGFSFLFYSSGSLFSLIHSNAELSFERIKSLCEDTAKVSSLSFFPLSLIEI